MNCQFEQSVYGSFPFWDKGYATLSSSPGCLGKWLAAFHVACRSIGEKPPAVGSVQGMMFCLPIEDDDAWMIVGVSSAGSDDRGRPGAMSFHGLFVMDAEFRKVRFDPFALTAALRADWKPGVVLESGSVAIDALPDPPNDERVAPIVAALVARRKVAIASEAPIMGLAQGVWKQLPEKVRRRCSVATWAFASGPQFDLVAAPNLRHWHLSHVYVDPFVEGPPVWNKISRTKEFVIAGVATLALLAVLATGIAIWRASRARTLVAAEEIEDTTYNDVSTNERHAVPRVLDNSVPPPDRKLYETAVLSLDEREEVSRKLVNLLRTLGIQNAGIEKHDDWSYELRSLYNWRYSGPLLNSSELAELGREPSFGRSRALEWDMRVRRFVADRPPPDDFDTGPLRWQIDTLAWSFHLEPNPKLTLLEAIDAIADSMTLDESVRQNALESKYPTLSIYAKFLRRLPVR